MNTFILIIILLLTHQIQASANSSIKKMFSVGDYEGVLEFVDSSKNGLDTEQKKYIYAISAIRLFRYEQAIQYLNKLKNKKYSDKSYLLGQCYFALKRNKKAAIAFKNSFRNNYKPDASLYYLGVIHKDLGLYNDAKNYFAQIHDVSFPDLNFIQAAHHQTALLYLDGYVKTKKLSKKVIRKKVLPKLKKAIQSAPELPLTSLIKQDIQFIKKKYLGEETFNPFNIHFNQFFNYNSNVVYQSVEPTINNTSSSGLLNSVFNARYKIKPSSSIGLENITNLTLNHQYHLDQDTANIARYDGYTIGLRNQIIATKLTIPIWLNIGYRTQGMNNQLSGELTHDNRSYSISLGSQFSFFGLKPNLELKYEYMTNFTSLNNQRNFSASSIVPLSFGQYLVFYLIGEIKINNYLNAETLSNNQLNGTITHIMHLNKNNKITTSASLGIIDTKEMIDQRGHEILIAPQIYYEANINSVLSWGLNYRYERKISKDQNTFAYDQHLAGVFFGVRYE